LAVLLITAIGTLNWRIDPLQFYRRAAYPPEFVEQARYQNPGLARNYPYDSVIAGTSVSLGFDAADVRHGLGWDALNLAMSGASAHEQSLILEVAIRTGKVRHVLWDLNFEYLRGSPDWVSDYDGAFPAYFYDENPWNEIPNYLLNADTCKATARVLLGFGHIQLYRRRTVAELSRLESAHPPGRESVLASLERARSAPSVFERQKEDFTVAKLEASFEANFVRVIREHPEITFELWYPPFSIARHAFLAEAAPEVWEQMFEWKRAVTAATAGLPNVRVHDFQGERAVIVDFNHYTDTVHFDAAIRERIIDEISRGTARATVESLAETEKVIREETAKFQAEGTRPRALAR